MPPTGRILLDTSILIALLAEESAKVTQPRWLFAAWAVVLAAI